MISHTICLASISRRVRRASSSSALDSLVKPPQLGSLPNEFLSYASDGVGGRVRTDIVDDFFLDGGFQIFITAYPESKKLLDYEALDLQRFYAGAKVFYGEKFHTVADPLRHLWDSVVSLTNPIGSVVDKGFIALMRAKDQSLLGFSSFSKLKEDSSFL